MIIFLFLVLILWYAIGMWGCITMSLRENGEFTIGDLWECLPIAFIGPIMWIIVAKDVFQEHGKRVLIKKNKD